jgi:hypothetical protein
LSKMDEVLYDMAWYIAHEGLYNRAWYIEQDEGKIV